MKKFTIILTVLIAMTITTNAQTASDYYMPMCVSNQTVLYTSENLDWAGRTTTHTFIKTDSISGELYFVEEGKEYLFETALFKSFRCFWLKKNVNGEIIIKALSVTGSSNLDSAIIFPVAGVYFSNNYFTTGYSITQPTGTNQTMTDSVISTNATFGIFNNCIQIREIVKTNEVIDIIDDKYYASGVGLVGGNRIFPTNEVHTAVFVSTFVTGCDSIVDTIPGNIVDTCFGQYFDYFVTDIQVDTMNNTVTVTWVFQDGAITNQFIQTYSYQYQGNNVISITIQCSKKTATTYYKTINIGSSPIGINESIETNSIINIYPNPAKDIITVGNTNNQTAVLDIYNLMGALVKTETIKQNQQQINVSDLSNGFYILEIKSDKFTGKQKLIIQR